MDEIKMKVHEKKRLYHKFLKSKTDGKRQQYLEAKRVAENAATAAKAAHYDEVSKK